MSDRTQRYENDPLSPRLARRHLTEVLGDHPRLGDIQVCVTEVANNVVLHTDSKGFDLTVHRDGELVRIEIRDDDPTLPRRKALGISAPTGRGLKLLDALTDEWDAVRTGAGKVVWFRVDGSAPA